MAQAIESVLDQTRPANEIIVSDDNSTDATLDICKQYSKILKLFTNDKGPSGFVNGWNRAIGYAKSDFISILHQDDLLAPTFLEEAEKALCQNPHVKHFFVPCNYIDAKSNIIQKPVFCDGHTHLYKGIDYLKAYRDLGEPHIHRCPGVITHREIFKQCQYRVEAGHIADDDFFYRVGQYTDVIGILKPLASYRIHNTSETEHIGDKALVKRLIKDYDFQIRHIDDCSLFDKEHLRYLKANKQKFIKRLLGYTRADRSFSDLLYLLRYV